MGANLGGKGGSGAAAAAATNLLASVLLEHVAWCRFGFGLVDPKHFDERFGVSIAI